MKIQTLSSLPNINPIFFTIISTILGFPLFKNIDPLSILCLNQDLQDAEGFNRIMSRLKILLNPSASYESNLGNKPITFI